jgi:hypothetical protein
VEVPEQFVGAVDEMNFQCPTGFMDVVSLTDS